MKAQCVGTEFDSKRSSGRLLGLRSWTGSETVVAPRSLSREFGRPVSLESEAILFPTEAAEEILVERGVGAEDLHLPPCRVEIVMGLSEENRLYVVLPTGAGLDLPFSCNAPFIQDPARNASMVHPPLSVLPQ